MTNRDNNEPTDNATPTDDATEVLSPMQHMQAAIKACVDVGLGGEHYGRLRGATVTELEADARKFSDEIEAARSSFRGHTATAVQTQRPPRTAQVRGRSFRSRR